MCKRFLSLTVCFALFAAIMLCGCKEQTDGEVYFLNFKPESADVYKEIAEKYKEETGVTVKVVTAAANTYEQTLKSEIAKSNAPTIFQVNGPIGFASWQDYCLNIEDSDFANLLVDGSMAIHGDDGSGVYAVPYVAEGYGIIYNDAVMQKYFSLPDRVTDITSAEQINDFALLKAVVEDMTARKSELGIEGVFASTSLAGGEDWRWQSHLLNVPLFYEFKDNEDYSDTTSAVLNAKEIALKYSQNYKNILDLYINNSITEKGVLGSKSTSDSMAEFALGKVAMVQNGNWAWSQIKDVNGNVVTAENVKFLPIYVGVDGEENQGLCIGTENYFAINKNVSVEKQQKSLDFLYWLFTSDIGKSYVTNKLGFITPFKSFAENEQPDDPLALEVIRYMNDTAKQTVPWVFTAFPSDVFKSEVGDNLLQYVQGNRDWSDAESRIKSKWKSERE